MCELVVARANAGAPGRRIVRGTVLCADDPIVLRAPRLFNPYVVQHYCSNSDPSPSSAGRVEQATAAPGEKRDLNLPEPPEGYPCDEPGCDVVAKSAAGLGAHKRSHRSD
jgi:hypothetical protein